MQRLRQIHRMIAARLDDDRQFLLKLEEVKLQTLAGSIHAAAGNKKGAAAAAKIRLARKKADDLPSFDKVSKLFGGAR